MAKRTPVTRRRFLQSGGRMAAGALVLGTLPSRHIPLAAPRSATHVLGANDRITLGVIGVNGRGQNHIDAFGAMSNVRIAALCDIDLNVVGERAAYVEKTFGYKPATYQHQQNLFENRDVDAVTIATPNHWHALGTIWACQAGKHVFVEKPCCHNVQEGRRMVEAARRYGRMVAVGFQNRSSRSVRQAMAFLGGGQLGEVYLARGLCFKARDPIGLVPDGVGTGPQYGYVVWNQPAGTTTAPIWTRSTTTPGSARPPSVRSTTTASTTTGTGTGITATATSATRGRISGTSPAGDSVRKRIRARSASNGGIFGGRSAQETPDTQAAEMIYPDGRMIEFEVRGLATNAEDGIMIGNLFFGTKGWLHLDGDEWQSYFGRKNEPGPGSKTADEGIFPIPWARPSRAATTPTSSVPSGRTTRPTPDLSHRGRFLVFRPAGPGEHLLPSRPRVILRRGKGKVRRRRQADRMLSRDYRRPYLLPKAA